MNVRRITVAVAIAVAACSLAGPGAHAAPKAVKINTGVTCVLGPDERPCC